MSTLLQDLRFGLRMLAKNPGFTAVAVLTLALGIGANTAIFSVVNAVLLRPLPYKEAGRLVWITQFIPRQNNMLVFDSTYFAWARRNQAFASMAAYGMRGRTLTGMGDATRVEVGTVTAGFFPTLGVTPILGRNFSADEDRPNGPPVCILSHTFWQNRLAGNPSRVGKTITLDGKPYTVLGVLPANFEFFEGGDQPALYVPFDLRETLGVAPGETHMFPWVIARLKPGVTIQRAESNLALIDRSIQSGFKGGYDKMMEGARAKIMPLRTRVAGDVSRALVMLQVAVGFVLLIACANVANLQLARAVARTKEIAVRAALGAGRGRMARQLLTESLLLAGLGALAGAALASGGVSILKALGPAKIPHLAQVSVDNRVLLFTVLVSLVTGLAFGLAPALAAARTQPGEWLKEGGLRLSAGPAGPRLRSFLVVAQLALALVLLTGAGLLAKSFLRLARTDPGFDFHHLLIAQVRLPDTQYPQPVQQREFFQMLLANLRTLPGVSAAEAVAVPPLRGYMMGAGFQIENRPMRTDVNQAAAINITSPDYFHAIGVPLLSGRSFTPQDSADAPKVAILNHTCARTFFPDTDPVGHRIKIASMDWVTIVGVTADVRQGGLEFKPLAEIFVPYLQMPYPIMTIVIRTGYAPLRLAGALRSEVQSIDKNLPVYGLKTMDQLLAEQFGSQRFNMALLGIFAFLAVSLATVGVYGVMTYSVAQRTHEIGIRLALGAEPANVLALVLRHGLILVGVGLGVGLIGAFALTQFIANLLYNVRPNDAATFIAVTLLLGTVAVLAIYMPARRAAKVDPMVALRYE